MYSCDIFTYYDWIPHDGITENNVAWNSLCICLFHYEKFISRHCQEVLSMAAFNFPFYSPFEVNASSPLGELRERKFEMFVTNLKLTGLIALSN